MPPNTLPWQPPDLAREPGLFSHMQIERVAAGRGLCHATLKHFGLDFDVGDGTLAALARWSNVPSIRPAGPVWRSLHYASVGEGMAQLFRPGANSIALFIIVAIFATPTAAVALAYFVWNSPYATNQGLTRSQPVPFSHAHHVGDLGLDCRMCHTSVENSAFAGIPSTHVCMTCHSQIWTNAAMLAPVRESLAKGEPLHWQRVNRLPDYVFFNHGIHIAKGIGCSTCHGPVQTMALMRQAAPLTMGWCLSCHRNPEKFIRPKNLVFDMDWIPPSDQAARGRKLMIEYHIHTQHLTDCSTCHR